MKKVIIVIVVIAVLVGGFFIVKNRTSARKTSSEISQVRLQVAQKESITTIVEADGTVETNKKEEIKAKLNGIIADIKVSEGDFVHKNQEIINLQDEELRNELETSKLNIVEVKANYQKLLSTYKKQDNINYLQILDAKRKLEIAELTLKQEILKLEDQRNNLKNNVRDTEDSLLKAKKELDEKKYLYENGAIPEKKLNEAKEIYKKAEKQYDKAREDYNRLINKTSPNNIRLARLNRDNAKSNLELLKANIEENKITENDLNIAKIKINKHEKILADIKKDLEKVVIISPINGTIIETNVRKDDKVLAGNTLATVADLKNLIIKAMVDEIDVNEVAVGQKVKITSDAFAAEIIGEVSFIAPTGTKEGNINKYKTEIKINNKDNILRPGMFVNTEIITNTKDNVVVLPSIAIIEDGENNYVYIAKDGVAKKRNIEIGLKNISKAEVHGIESGEKVIIGPFNVLQNLKDGQSVTEINNEKIDS